MDAAEFAKAFGLPGLVLMVWYLLEKARIERNAKTEDKKTEAMTTGFQSLSTKIDWHAAEDAEHHADRQAEMAELKGQLSTLLDITPVEGIKPVKRKTPARGVATPPGYYPPHRPKTSGEGR